MRPHLCNCACSSSGPSLAGLAAYSSVLCLRRTSMSRALHFSLTKRLVHPFFLGGPWNSSLACQQVAGLSHVPAAWNKMEKIRTSASCGLEIAATVDVDDCLPFHVGELIGCFTNMAPPQADKCFGFASIHATGTTKTFQASTSVFCDLRAPQG